MTDFWKEMKQGVECIKLVEQFLREEEHLLNYLKERGMSTACSEYRIARMQFALGKISVRPDYRTYFSTKTEVTQHEDERNN